jgi:NAD(P)-dependent dehydrogenase (short-subunit alcohol dehydrogenase family)
MPGPVLTDGMPPTPEFEILKGKLLDMTRAERRFGTVEDIADSVLLLANEKSRWITGESISVSGGIVGN